MMHISIEVHISIPYSEASEGQGIQILSALSNRLENLLFSKHRYFSGDPILLSHLQVPIGNPRMDYIPRSQTGAERQLPLALE